MSQVAAMPVFEDRWDDPAAYLNADSAGRPHYPGFGAEAVRWLVAHRSIGALGIDTMGIDLGADTTFCANQLFVGWDQGTRALALLGEL